MWTYFIASPDAVKIGKTSLAPAKRLKQIQANSPIVLTLLFVIVGDFEKDCHVRFRQHRRSGSEWFELSEEILEFVDGGWRTVEELQIVENFSEDNIGNFLRHAKIGFLDLREGNA